MAYRSRGRRSFRRGRPSRGRRGGRRRGKPLRRGRGRSSMLVSRGGIRM